MQKYAKNMQKHTKVCKNAYKTKILPWHRKIVLGGISYILCFLHLLVLAFSSKHLNFGTRHFKYLNSYARML